MYSEIATTGKTDQIIDYWQAPSDSQEEGDAKEHVRGLFLVFEQLAESGCEPFNDGRIRYPQSHFSSVDWRRLPAHLGEWIPLIQRYQQLVTEWDVYQYIQHASREQRYEMAALCKGIREHGDSLRAWCVENFNTESPFFVEAARLSTLFVLFDQLDGWKEGGD